MKNRFAAAIATVLFLLLAGTGVGHAYWSTASTVSSSVTAGAIGITQTGFADLAIDYTADALTDTAEITVENSGTISAPFTLALSAQSDDTLTAAIGVWLWKVTASTPCSSTADAQGARATWTTVPAETGTLPAAASVVFCVRSSVTTTEVENNQGRSMIATLALSSSVGSWSATTSATAAQSVPDTIAPTTPTALAAAPTSGYSAELTWNASADGVGVIAYDVYRDSSTTPIATVTAPRYLDQSLTQNTTYAYAVKARDAAGHVSSAATTSATTFPIVSTTWYRVILQSSGRCVDANNAKSSDGTPLIVYDCNGQANQSWRFVPTTDGYYKVLAQHAPASGWSVAPGGDTADGAKAVLWSYSGTKNQQWRIVQQATGVYSFVAQSSGECLTNGTGLSLSTCTPTTAQYFTLAGE